MPEESKHTLAQLIEQDPAYPDTQSRELIKALCAFESLEDESNLIVSNGAAELIYALVEYVRPKKALIPIPSFSSYASACEVFDVDICTYTLKEELGFRLDEGFLESLSDDIELVFLCHPHNPTAQLINEKLLKAIIKTCEEKEIFLIIDECFIELSDQPELSAVHHFHAQEPKKHLCVLKALTKSHALAGLRLGYGIAEPKLIQALKMRRQSWPVSSFAQEAGLAALKDEVYLTRSRDLIAYERQRLRSALKSLGAKVYRSDVNFLLFESDIPQLGEALENKGILIRDCSNFEGLRVGYYRIGIRSAKDNDVLIEALTEIGSAHGA